MKRSFIIGMVWTGLVVCVLSFGTTVYFLENAKRQNESDELVEKSKLQNVYITDESSIRTNNFVNLEGNNELELSSLFKNEDGNLKDIRSEEQANTKSNIEEETIESISSNASAFIKPVNGEVMNPLSMDSLIFSKTLQEWTVHKGTDYKAQLGNEVYAVRSGKIKEIKFDYIYGEYIVIEHDDGYESLYANITVLDALKVGDGIKQGEMIGYVAESFGYEVAEETHLHFELKKDGKYLSI